MSIIFCQSTWIIIMTIMRIHLQQLMYGMCLAYKHYLHDRSWISPWIKSISNELDITIHVIASQLSGHCDVISNRLWHQQNENRASETRGRCVKIVVLSSFMDSFCRVSNRITYVASWRTVSVLTRMLFWYSFPLLLRNSGNKHQNNPFVGAERVKIIIAGKTRGR